MSATEETKKAPRPEAVVLLKAIALCVALPACGLVTYALLRRVPLVSRRLI